MIRRGARLALQQTQSACCSAPSSPSLGPITGAAIPSLPCHSTSRSTRATSSQHPLPCRGQRQGGRSRFHSQATLREAQSSQDVTPVEADASDDLPWFMQPQEASGSASSSSQPQQETESVHTPQHLVRTPQLQELHQILTTPPLSKLIAQPDDLLNYDQLTHTSSDGATTTVDPAAEQPIIYLPTAAIAAALPPHEGAGVASWDWVILIRAKTAAGGALSKIALEVGNFLKHARPPASRARSHLEQVELQHGSSHLGGDLFGTASTSRHSPLKLTASQGEFAELVIALEAWTRQHGFPSVFLGGAEKTSARGLFDEMTTTSTETAAGGLPMASPISALRSARIRRTFRPLPIKTIAATDDEEAGPRPSGWSRIEWEAGRRLPTWAIQKEALRRKLAVASQQSHESDVSGHRQQAKPFWRPGKILSRSAQEGIRTLHAYDPKGRFSASELSRAFGISPESVRRILRAGGRRSTPATGSPDAENEAEPIDLDDVRANTGPPSWLKRENATLLDRIGDHQEEVETVEARQERRASERRAARVQVIIERILRERSVMDEGEDEQMELEFSSRRSLDAPAHLDVEDFETRQIMQRANQSRLAAAAPARNPDEDVNEGVDEELSVETEEWTQPIHYEGLSSAQSQSLSSSSTAPSSRPAFKAARGAMTGRRRSVARGDGNGNWVIVDAGWCVVHVLSESGWDTYGPKGGIGDVWREWLNMAERERGWVPPPPSGRDQDGTQAAGGGGQLAKAFGLGEKKKRKVHDRRGSALSRYNNSSGTGSRLAGSSY
ncbi:hypothetical protein V8E36_007502 [Tilletia maclaganii]